MNPNQAKMEKVVKARTNLYPTQDDSCYLNLKVLGRADSEGLRKLASEAQDHPLEMKIEMAGRLVVFFIYIRAQPFIPLRLKFNLAPSGRQAEKVLNILAFIDRPQISFFSSSEQGEAFEATFVIKDFSQSGVKVPERVC